MNYTTLDKIADWALTFIALYTPILAAIVLVRSVG